jgi:membrane dipeptidase
MNRLGMLIDLSHVSHQTMRDVLSQTKAPIIFSHSGAYGISKHLRNVPDDVLRSVAQNNGIVMANFVTKFLNAENPEAATIHDVVDHIFHIAEVAGWDHVGVGGDFDGTTMVPKGLEVCEKGSLNFSYSKLNVNHPGRLQIPPPRRTNDGARRNRRASP